MCLFTSLIFLTLKLVCYIAKVCSGCSSTRNKYNSNVCLCCSAPPLRRGIVFSRRNPIRLG